MQRCFLPLSFSIVIWLIAPSAYGQHLRPDYSIPDVTLSPDHRFGMTVPQLDYFESDLKKVTPFEYTVNISDDSRNSVVEVKTGKVLGVINANTGWDHMGHGDVLPTRWSPDGSLLLWEVSGKWCSWALVLLKIEDGTVKWQIDLLKTAQQAILLRTRKAQPQKYLAVIKHNAGYGSAYPDGFTVDVSAGDDGDKSVSLPLKVRADLTSNYKHISTWPDEAELDATVDRDSHFVVDKFRLLPRPAPWD